MGTCTACGAAHAEGARFCSACGTRLTPPDQATRKTVTIVFADLVGSTTLAERLDPEVLSGLLQRYFDEVRGCLEAHGGTVEKYIGDAVVGVFGIPAVHEDDALRALRAALALRAAVDGLDADHGAPLRVRVGVATGEVLAQSASAATLMSGDAGNLAARLEQAALPGEILIAPSTHRLVRQFVDTETTGPLTLKGKAEPVVAHRLRAVRTDAEAVPRRQDAPMVGRRRQLDTTMLAYAGAIEDGACALVTILGDAGVGKSRLAAEVLARAAQDATVLTGRCLPYGRGITYWPIAEMIHQVCDGATDVGGGLRAALRGGDQSETVAGILATVAGAGSAGSREELPWAVRKLFEHLAGQRPLVAFFEDVHWAEPTLLDLIENVVDSSRAAPILVLCTARPELLETRPGCGGGKLRASSMLLEPLSSAETAELIRNQLGGDVEETARQRIAAAAEGNPLFIEQLLAMLVDDGRLTLREGDWGLAGGGELSIPPSIQALLAARLDRLTTAERRVVEVGAVVGKEFDRPALEGIIGDTQVAVDAGLDGLLRKDLIRSEPAVGQQRPYRFRHVLIRDAAYESVAKQRRAALHQRFADWLIESQNGRIAEYEEIIGYHLEQACRYVRELSPQDPHGDALAGRAAGHLYRSGRRALHRRDMGAAEDLLTRSRALRSPDSVERASADIALGMAYTETGSFDQARRFLEEAGAVARARHDRGLELHAELRLAAVALSVEPEGASARCRAIAEEAIPVFTAAGDHAGLSLAWYLWAEPDHDACVWEPMAEALERSLAEARLAGDDHDLTPFLVWLLAHATTWGPRPVPESVARCRSLLAETAGVPELAGRIRTRIALLESMAGRHEEAVQTLAEVEAMLRDLGTGYWLGSFGLNASSVYQWSGRLDDAERLLRAADTELAAAGERSLRSTVLSSLAQVCIEAGRVDDADRTALLALEIGSSDDLATVVDSLCVHAQALAARGDHGEAHAVMLSAIERSGATDMPVMLGDLWDAYGRVLHAAGRRQDAAAAFDRAAAVLERKGAHALVERVRRRAAALDA